MAMTVMEVREVRMAMREPSMAVAMGMWLSRRVVRCVCVLVMRVMDMSVLVLLSKRIYPLGQSARRNGRTC